MSNKDTMPTLTENQPTNSMMLKLPNSAYRQLEQLADKKGLPLPQTAESILNDYFSGRLVSTDTAGSADFFDKFYHFLGNNFHNTFARGLHEALKCYRKGIALPNDTGRD